MFSSQRNSFSGFSKPPGSKVPFQCPPRPLIPFSTASGLPAVPAAASFFWDNRRHPRPAAAAALPPATAARSLTGTVRSVTGHHAANPAHEQVIAILFLLVCQYPGHRQLARQPAGCTDGNSFSVACPTDFQHHVPENQDQVAGCSDAVFRVGLPRCQAINGLGKMFVGYLILLLWSRCNSARILIWLQFPLIRL